MEDSVLEEEIEQNVKSAQYQPPANYVHNGQFCSRVLCQKPTFSTNDLAQ